MEFGIKKCAMFIMKSRKRETMEAIEPPNQESSECLERKKLQY